VDRRPSYRSWLIKEVSERHKISRSKLYKDMERGLLSYLQLGRMRRILDSDLEDYLQRHRVAAR
jgi:excisionase family DNA binding protein